MTVRSDDNNNNDDDDNGKIGVVVIGSSGGGRATLGNEHSPLELFQCLENELNRINASIVFALFVHCDVGFDGITTETQEEETMATLYTIGFDDSLGQQQWRGTLKEVNKRCEELDRTILSQVILPSSSAKLTNQFGQKTQSVHHNDNDDSIKKVRTNNNIGGLISISCHAEWIHKHSLQAAATRQIPVTGSGGTSLSYACSNYGIHLVGNSGGSVATTTYTKAVSYTHALAKAHIRPYPYNHNNSSPKITIASFVSILNTCLPSFLAVSLLNQFITPFFIHHPSDDIHHNTINTITSKIHNHPIQNNTYFNDPFLWLLQNQVLPTVCAVVTATTLAPQHQSSVIMASSIASMACSSSILSGMFAGYLISILVRFNNNNIIKSLFISPYLLMMTWKQIQN